MRTLTSLLVAVAVFGICTEESDASRLSRGYAEELAESDIIVVGTVVDTEDFDPQSSDRVSRVELSAVLYGAVGSVDTIRVHWRSSSHSIAMGPYEQLWVEGSPLRIREAADTPILWVLGCCRDSLPFVRYESQVLLPKHSPKLHRLVGELSRNGGAESGSPQVRAVHAFLEGYLAGLSAGWRKVADEWRAN
jgi:hypothetical protein